MATYVIGDLQGCFETFQALLKQIGWTQQDRLWLVGDLVNRGPQSLDILEWILDRPSQVQTVLGNHDLHLLACLHGVSPTRKDTFQDCLSHPRAMEFKEWLRHQPLLFEEQGQAMVHAGVCPTWSWKEVQKRARRAEQALQSQVGLDEFVTIHRKIHRVKKKKKKNQTHSLTSEPSSLPQKISDPYLSPNPHPVAEQAVQLSSENSSLQTLSSSSSLSTSVPPWIDDLGWFTRVRTVRYLEDQRQVERDENFKGALSEIIPPNVPWFTLFEEIRKQRAFSYPNVIYFGHWAALGMYRSGHTFSLDTGCIWGRYLSAVRLEDGALFQHPTLEKAWTPKNQRSSRV